MFPQSALAILLLMTPLVAQVKFGQLRGVGLVDYTGYVGKGNRSEGVHAVNAWGDIDGDGDVDACGGPTMTMHQDRTWSLSTVLINDGSGQLKDSSFSSATRVKVAPKIWGTTMVLLVDLDGDGDLDQVSAHNPLVKNSNLENARYLKNDGKGFFTEASQLLNAPRLITPWVAQIRANADSSPDLIFVAWGDPSVLLINDGKGAFKPSLSTGWRSLRAYDALVGDFDRDGDEDVIFVIYDPQSANPYYLNDGKGHFTTKHRKKFPIPVETGLSGAVGDLDGDGDLDLVFGQERRDKVMRPDRILWNDGKGNFAMTTLPGIKSLAGGHPFGTSTIALGDVDGDGDLDLVMGYTGGLLSKKPTNTTRIYENLGNRKFREFKNAIFEAGLSHKITLVDFDHDGDLDLLSSKGFNFMPPNRVWMNLTRQIHFREPPKIGKVLSLDVYSTRNRVLTMSYVGFQRSKLTVQPFGNWWLSPSSMFYVGLSNFVTQSGKLTLSLPIPSLSGLVGQELHAQSLYYDGARRTLHFSNLMRERILK